MKAFYTTKTMLAAYLCCVFYLLIPSSSSAQSEPNSPVTYDTTITEKANGEGPFTWNVRITRQKSDRNLRPGIFFIPGSGEVGTNAALLTNYGPHYWLLNGWDGGVKLGNGTHYPVIVSIQQPTQNMRPWHLKAVLEALLNVLPVKRNSVHVAGLSQGSYEWGELIGFAASKGDETAMSEIKSWVDLEGVGPGDNFLGYDPPFPQAYQTWVSKYGGKFFGLEGTNDSRNIWQLTQPMNTAKANSAYFAYENIGGGGHCCWNSMFDPSVKSWIAGQNANVVASTNPATTYGSYFYSASTGSSVFQWMIRQGDTSMVGSTSSTPPPTSTTPPAVSFSGATSVQLPTNSITLYPAATFYGGATLKSCTLSQVSGPNTATLSNITGTTPFVNNMVAGTYSFKETVTDSYGNVGSATVSVTCRAASTPSAPATSPSTQAPTVTFSGATSVQLPTNSITIYPAATFYGGATLKSATLSQVSGPSAATLSNVTGTTPFVNNMVAGTYSFKETVIDSYGNTGSATINITCRAASTTTTTPPPTTTTGTGTITPSMVKTFVAPGEYQVFFLDQNKKLYSMGTNLYTQGVNGAGVPGTTLKPAVPSTLTFTYAAAGLHGGAAVDNNGNVWAWGDNDQGQCGNGVTSTSQQLNPVQVTTDVTGATFTNVKFLTAFYSGNVSSGWYAIKNDGTLWVWGQTLGGMQGDGTTGNSALTRPKQISMPGGRQVSQVVAGNHAIVLCTDGTVWIFGGSGEMPQNLGYASTSTSYLSPVQLTGLSNIVQISGGGPFNYALDANGKLFGWGYWGSYLGGASVNNPVATPIDLTTRLNLPKPIKMVTSNMDCTHVILTDGTLWGWGENAQGEIGNGQERNWATAPYPYSWDYSPMQLMQITPTQITSRNDFVAVFGTQPFVMYTYAETADGTIYSWGRNKGGVLANGITGCSAVTASYPNSWDVTTPTIVTPLSVTVATQVPSPYCIANPATSPCNTCSLTNVVKTAAEGPASVAASANTLANDAASSLTKESFDIYPTVTNGTLNVRISSDVTGLVQMAIYDISGRLMEIDRTSKDGQVMTQTLNVGRLVAGTYTMQVLIGTQKKMTGRFVKQ